VSHAWREGAEEGTGPIGEVVRKLRKMCRRLGFPVDGTVRIQKVIGLGICSLCSTYRVNQGTIPSWAFGRDTHRSRRDTGL
jgi:hypothetical protein